MNPQELSSASDEAMQNVENPLKVMQPGERVVCHIKRHPIGLFGQYGTLAFVILLAIAAIAGGPKLVPSMTTQGQAVTALGGVIICALVGLFTYVSVVVYKGNRWIVTTDSITQISQVSLFRKQTSQLSLANLEDVTVEQDGILQSIFGFGRLRAETAGERSKFVFNYCPNPANYAKVIINAHENYIAEKPEEMHTTNRAVANTSGFNQSYAPPQEYAEMQSGQQPAPQPQYGAAPSQQQQYQPSQPQPQQGYQQSQPAPPPVQQPPYGPNGQ